MNSDFLITLVLLIAVFIFAIVKTYNFGYEKGKADAEDIEL